MKQKKFKSVILGVALLLIAAALILESLGALTILSDIAGGISLPRILLAVVLISIAVIGCRRHPLHIVWYIAFLFMLFERNIAYLCGRTDPNLINNWLVLLCALLIHIALRLLLGNRNHGSKWNFHIPGHIGMGSNTVYIDCTDFQNKHIENNMGAAAIYFTNIESYQGGGRLIIENNLGQTTVAVPASWSLSMETENNLGHIDAPSGTGTPNGPTLFIEAENNLGQISVRFV